jgi:hypothetical protein
MPPQTSNDDSLGVLRGAKQIGAYVDLRDDDGKVDERATYYLLEKGLLPAFKQGGIWITTKARLREHYNTLASKPPATSTKPSEPNAGTEAAPPPPRPARAPRSRRLAK